MPQKAISPRHIKGLLIQHSIQGASTRLIARSFKIARSTVGAYIKLYNHSDLVYTNILNLSANNIAIAIRPQNSIYKDTKYAALHDRFLQYHHWPENININLKTLWQEYKQNEPSGLKYSGFVDHYHMWRKENGFSKVNYNKYQISNISKDDEITLRKWRLSNNRGKWERAVALLDLYKGCNIKEISNKVERSCRTIKKWHAVYVDDGLAYLDLHRNRVTQEQAKNAKYSALHDRLLQYHHRSENENINLKTLWQEYKQNEPSGLKYSGFVDHYHMWCKKNGFSKVNFNKYKINHISKEDEISLNKWRLSSNRGKWACAVALLDLQKGCNITEISNKVERSCRTIKKWHASYINNGMAHLDLRRTRVIPERIIDNIKLKKERIIKLIHESPSLHDINRTSWGLQTLAQAYNKIYDETIGRASISEYIRSEGYTFKKARTVLTSPDPEYRTKLQKITDILSNLKLNEKFFSIDEFGPVGIKIRGGRTFSPKDQTPTIPQFQKSKGSLICTAALELSTNQVIHFYSSKKNTDEMIRLLEILIYKYTTEERIFFSWDAASWHASKKLYEKVIEVNNPEYRNKYNTPFVELAPLPSSAQFLNVIESVFSGMARAIIHNSDYQSIDECKLAIDIYFSERNQAFLENPKRAGKIIWGKEIVKAVFKDCNNCKDPNYR